MTRLIVDHSLNLQRDQETPAASAPPLFRGMWASINRELGVEKLEGGPMKWEAQAVRRENGQRHLSLPVFSRSFFLHPPLTPVTPRLPPTTTSLASKCEPEVVTVVVSTRLPPPPPPSHPNASRWFFSLFQPDSHHHYLPRVQVRAGGSFFRRLDPTPTTTTSLASKREPEVVHFGSFDPTPTTPPPSHSNASWRWFFFVVSTVCHHYHLPCVQTRAGGGCFRLFRCDCHHTTSLAFKREPEVVFFRRFDMPPTTTSLASKREPGVVYFVLSTCLPSPPPPSRPSASRRWFFSVFRHGSHHHLPRVRTRAGGGVFRCFDEAPTTTTSLASKREPEVVLFGGFEGM